MAKSVKIDDSIFSDSASDFAKYKYELDDERKETEKRALVRVIIDDDQEEKPKRRRFCECDPDAISVEEEE